MKIKQVRAMNAIGFSGIRPSLFELVEIFRGLAWTGMTICETKPENTENWPNKLTTLGSRKNCSNWRTFATRSPTISRIT